MSNYNFVPTLSGLNNIEANEIISDSINSSSGNITNLTIGSLTGDTLTNCTLINCDCNADPTDDLGVATKQYVDNNFCDLTTDQFISGEKGFQNNISFNATAQHNEYAEFNGQTVFQYYPIISYTTGDAPENLIRNDQVDNKLLYYATISGYNTFTGLNLFNNFCPQTSISAITNNDLTNKLFVDSLLLNYPKLATDNTFTQINTFTNTTEFDGATNYYDQASFYGFCPKALIPPTISTNLTNKNYVDGQITATNTFLQSYITGVYMIHLLSGVKNFSFYPIYKSTTNLTNAFAQPTTSGAVSTAQSGSAVGNYYGFDINDHDDSWVVFPGWGLIVYENAGYTGTIRVNFKNTTSGKVNITPNVTLRGTSVKIYYNDVEQT